MDYQSFQPGGQDKNLAPVQDLVHALVTPPPMEPMSQKTFTPKFIGIIILLLVLGAGAYGAMWYWGNQQQSAIYTFEECVKAKDSKMLETYPEQCVTSDGKSFPNPDQILNDSNTGGEFCGGITGKLCPGGYTCKLDGSYPDAGGTCIKE